jgi:hypothetical protein
VIHAAASSGFSLGLELSRKLPKKVFVEMMETLDSCRKSVDEGQDPPNIDIHIIAKVVRRNKRKAQ